MATYLGPLITTYAPPASCLQTTTFYREYDDPGVKLLDDANCYPDGYVTNGFYSPGTICPSGYRGYTENDGAETSINCCPSGFQFSGPWPGKCSTVETVLTIAVFVTGDATQTTSTQFYPPSATLYASAVQLRYRSVDTIATTSLPSSTFPSTSAASSSDSASIFSMQPSPIASTSATAAPAATSNSLSMGGKVAIAVVVPLVAIMLFGLLLLIRRRHIKKRNGAGEVTAHELPSQETYKDEKNLAEVQGSFVRPRQPAVELDAEPK